MSRAPTRPPERAEHYRGLDGIRALAAMLVFLAHAGLQARVPGGFAVTVFFVLSGYLITTRLRLEYQSTGSISVVQFYRRRARRILPPLYATLLLAALVPLPTWTGTPTPAGVAAQLMQVTNYYQIAHGIAHFLPYTNVLWSLAIEEHFYLCYPPLLLACLCRFGLRRSAAILVGLCVLVLGWRLVLVCGLGVGEAYTYVATDTRIDSLLWGCVLGLCAHPSLDPPQRERGAGYWSAVLLAASSVVMLSFAYRAPAFRETWRYTLQSAAVLPFLYAASRYAEWPVFRWLEWAPVRAFGVVSYPFYLLHLMVLARVSASLPGHGPALRGIVAFVVTTGCASLLHRLTRGRACATPAQDAGQSATAIPVQPAAPGS